MVGLGAPALSSAFFLQEPAPSHGFRLQGSEAQLQKEIPALLDRGIIVETGGHGERTFRDQDLIVVSPGVPSDQPQLQHARRWEFP